MRAHGVNDQARVGLRPCLAGVVGLAAGLSTGLSVGLSVGAASASPPEPGWWRDAVFYEVFVRSYADSTAGPLAGDGVGDLAGLIERLDYLNDGDPATRTDLGVTALWLMPIFESPSYHGYDITDFRTIDREYGTNDDFRRLIAECERRGVAVVLDLVLNHVSWRHPWFEASKDPASETRDWFIWLDQDPGWKGDWGAPCWHTVPPSRPGRAGQAGERPGEQVGEQAGGPVYFGLFWHGMPDLNYRTPAVTREAYDISRFWLTEMGAHGFRLDAVRHLIEEGERQSSTPSTLAWLAEYNAYLKTVNPAAFTVGEVWSDTADVARYIPASLDSAFEFALAEAMAAAAAASGTPNAAKATADLAQRIATVAAAYPADTACTFLTNHDQNRLMSRLVGPGGAPDEAAFTRAKLAATLLLTLPGVPFIYYGEELGVTGEKPDENLRTPMPWQADTARGGFTTGTPWRAVRADAAQGVSIAAQRGTPGSLLEHYRELISLRRGTPALARGPVRVVGEGLPPGVLAYVRGEGDDRAVVVLNFSAEAVGLADLVEAAGLADVGAGAGAGSGDGAGAAGAPAERRDAGPTLRQVFPEVAEGPGGQGPGGEVGGGEVRGGRVRIPAGEARVFAVDTGA